MRQETGKNPLLLDNVYLTEQRLKVEDKQGDTDKQRLHGKKGRKEEVEKLFQSNIQEKCLRERNLTESPRNTWSAQLEGEPGIQLQSFG